MAVADDVAAIDHPGARSAKQCAADIEIVAVEAAQRPLAAAAYMRRSVGLVVRNLVDRVGGAVGHADDGDIGLEPVVIEADREVVEGLKFPTGSGCQSLFHGPSNSILASQCALNRLFRQRDNKLTGRRMSWRPATGDSRFACV